MFLSYRWNCDSVSHAMQCLDIITQSKPKASFVHTCCPTKADTECTFQNIDSDRSLNGDAI